MSPPILVTAPPALVADHDGAPRRASCRLPQVLPDPIRNRENLTSTAFSRYT
jgi:hypothetical protein